MAAVPPPPKIYRAMESENGAPLVGCGRNRLGARVPPGEVVDIHPDPAGNVAPNGEGVSVNPSLSAMRMVHIPRRWRELDKRFRAARGEAPVEVFTLGAGPFEDGSLNASLALKCDGPKHGVLEPAHTMALGAYQEALAATRPQWRLLPDPDDS